MSRDWTKEELDTASRFMKSKGFPSYEEFCRMLDEQMEKQGIEIPKEKEKQNNDD